MELLVFGTICLLLTFYFEFKNSPDLINVNSSLNSYYSREKVNLLANLFYQEWIKQYPEDTVKFNKALNTVSIKWEHYRILYKNQTVMAIMDNPRSIRIWIGPRFKHGERKILFTGLLDQLALLALVSNEKEPDTSSSSVRKIINAVALQFKSIELSEKVELPNQG